MGKNKKYVIENIAVLDFAAEGKCIIKNEGEVIFIEGANICPGDEVKLLVKKTKKNYSEGRVLQVNKLSSDRIQPFCQHFGVCGGCKWQHIPYEIQLKQKNKQVIDQLERIGKISLKNTNPILGSANTSFYRNKLEFTFSNSRWLTDNDAENLEDKSGLGFHVPRRFDKVLPIEKCHLQADPSNPILNFFNDYAFKSGMPFYNHVDHVGFFRTLMIRVASTGQYMVVLQVAQDNIEEINKVMEAFYATFPDVTSLHYIINTKKNDTYFDLNPVNYKGKAYIEEEMEGLRFRIGVKSFYQTNSYQAYELYKKVREYAQVKDTDIVYDLYTGTGTIANFVAKEAKKVVGIEYIEDAVKDAHINSENNKIYNTEFHFGDMAKILNADFIEKHGKPDIVITDPPRAGMDKAVCELLLTVLPRKIVYVSCNAATQARDLGILKEKYEVCGVQPVDMFPHTFHVENIVSLDLIS